MATQAISKSLPLGMMFNKIGAETEYWAGGMTISLQIPGEEVRHFSYDFSKSAWFERAGSGSSKQVAVTVVRGLIERIFSAIQ